MASTLFSILTLCALLAYTIYALAHWAHFVHDWQHQLGTRQFADIQLLLFRPDQLAFALLTGLTLYFTFTGSRLRRENRRVLLLMALTFWLTRQLGMGWAYGVFNILAVTLVLAVFIDCLPERLQRPGTSPQFPSFSIFHFPFSIKFLISHFSFLISAVAIGVLIASKTYSLPFVPATYHWLGMQPEGAQPEAYLTHEDSWAVNQYLRSHCPPQQQAGRVRRPYLFTIPDGDGMLLSPQGTRHYLHVLPIFWLQKPDYLLVHRFQADDFCADAYAEAAVSAGGVLPPPFYKRGSHTWHFIPLAGKPTPFLFSKP